jgi:hypothetical protein
VGFADRTAANIAVIEVICPAGNLSTLLSSPILKNILLRG